MELKSAYFQLSVGIHPIFIQNLQNFETKFPKQNILIANKKPRNLVKIIHKNIFLSENPGGLKVPDPRDPHHWIFVKICQCC